MRILILFVVLLASVFAQDRDDALKINPRGCGLRRNSAALGSQSNLLIGSVFNAQIANKGGIYLELLIFTFVILILFLFYLAYVYFYLRDKIRKHVDFFVEANIKN